MGVAVGVGVAVGEGRAATRVASRDSAYRLASSSASAAVRVANSTARRWASIASIALLVASKSGGGPMVGKGVGVDTT